MQCPAVVAALLHRRPPTILPLLLFLSSSLCLFRPSNVAALGVDRETCPSNVCFNGGQCFVDRDTKQFDCECQDGFGGDLCESSCALKCLNGGKCRKSAERGEWCDCAKGFGSPTCAERLSVERAEETEAELAADCRQNGCPFAHACFQDPATGGFLCDWDLCVRWGPPCANNATCKPTKNDFLCDCPPGFRGRQCAEDVDECAEGEQCQNGGECVNTLGSFKCRCTPGHKGERCEEQVNACEKAPCKNGAKCQNLDKGDYKCHCPANFTGRSCDQELPPECQDPFVSARSENGSRWECVCPEGRVGDQCELTATDCLGKGAQSGCLNGGQCVPMGTRAFCICPTGFAGPRCDEREAGKECTVKGRHCLNGGSCVQRDNGTSVCLCSARFTGTLCEFVSNATNPLIPTTTARSHTSEESQGTARQRFSPCSPNPCRNGGKCSESRQGAQCQCPPGKAVGKWCQLECNCAQGQRCVESAVEPGKAECIREDENNSGLPNGTNPTEVPFSGASTVSPPLLVGREDDELLFPSQGEIGDEEGQTGEGGEQEDEAEGERRAFEVNGTLTRNVTSCAECVNAIKCVQRAGEPLFRCLCTADFDGPLCDVRRPSTECTSLACPQPGQRCLLSRHGGPNGEDSAKCGCEPGMGGLRCGRANTMSLSNSSVLLLQQSATGRKSADYRLSLAFRTTLPNAHLATGESLMGHTEFSLLLRGGQLVLRLSGANRSHSAETEQLFDSALHLNDADWYSVGVWSTRKQGVGFELRHPESGYLLARRVLSGIGSLSVWNTRLGQRGPDASFVGCMRDVTLNGAEPVGAEDERAIGVRAGCQRQEQCPSDSRRCANGGRCVDLWDSFSCYCARPFLPPRCESQMREATFGHDDEPSNCLYALSAQDKASVAQRTDISFLLRTAPSGLNNSAMALFYLGEVMNGPDGETSTFVSAELHDGVPRVNARLGGRQVLSMEGTGPRLDDGKVHLVEVHRNGNELALWVDAREESPLHITRPFAHPLLADQLLVGARPEPNLPSGAFSGTSTHFKGTLHDFRVNGLFVPFDNFHSDLPLFGHKLSDQNLLQGTVSDDVCAILGAIGTAQGQEAPCGKHGRCENTFNDFECKCERGWTGPRCEQQDFCGHSEGQNGSSPSLTTAICPAGSECHNAAEGFVCTSTASLTPNGALRYVLQRQGTGNARLRVDKFSLELRTRSQNGHLLKMQSSSAVLVLQLRNGRLQVSTSNGSTSSTAPTTISDGQWHSLTLRNPNSGNNAISVAVDGTEMAMDRPTNFSLQHFVDDRGVARLSVGRVPEQDGIKGCLRNLQMGGLPPLSFQTAQEVPQMGESLSRTETHFALQKRENVRTGGECRSTDVCAGSPCLNGGQCEDLFNAMRCRCAPGFEGEWCEINRDECALHDGPAQCSAPNGRCVDQVNGFRCQCAPGFSGPKCTLTEELCKKGTCRNGKCQTLNGTAVCECASKFVGAWCQLEANTKCSETPCQNGAQCFQSTHGEFGCSCAPGFSGPLCELRSDPCREQPCANGGKCVTQEDPLSFRCECPREFEGARCERLADVCRQGVVCSGHGAKCENVWGGHMCVCAEGWRGRDCSVRVDPCAEEMPCVNGGSCSRADNGTGFSCRCPPFHLGERCEIAGACADNPCQNGGECVQSSPTEHSCRCPRGYRGLDCEERVDLCESEPCQNGGTCSPLVADFRCACIPGFIGKRCEVDIDECAVQRTDGVAQCLNGGKCRDRVNGFECDCRGTGYKGQRCDQDTDECAETPQTCLNGATCTNTPGEYRCECRPGYVGQRCHMQDPCVPNPLTNRTLHNCAHGKCVRPRVVTGASGREFVQHECDCVEGFAGELCMHLIEPQHQMSLSNFVALGAVVLVLCVCLGVLLYVFVSCTRRKRANQGTYSPSTQEMTAQSRFCGGVRRPQFQRQPLHQNQPHHHKPKRKK